MYTGDIKCLVLSGGGLRGGPLLSSALWQLSNVANIDFISPKRRLNEVRGTSMGAYMATLVACRADLFGIVEECQNLKIETYTEWSINSLLLSHGLNNGDELLHYIESRIEKNTGLNKPSFKQLYTWSNVDLKITACDIEQADEAVFNHINTPDVEVAQAVVASMSIPFFFSPRKLKYKNCTTTLLDGALVNNFPISGAGGDCNPETTLGLHICEGNDPLIPEIPSKRKTDVVSFSYWEILVKAITKLLDNNAAQQEKRKDILTIKLPSSRRSTMTTWKLSTGERELLMKSAVDAVDKFLELNMLSSQPSTNSISTQT